MEIQTIIVKSEEKDLINGFMNEQLPDEIGWQHLMPVVEKIGSLNPDERVTHMYSVEINLNGTSIFPAIYTSETKWLIRNNSRNLLLNTYRSVVEFIKWYNENQKK